MFGNPTPGFGTNPTTSATTGFSFGGAATTAAPTFGGFGTTATAAAPTGFGFGATAPPAATGLFGTATSTAPVATGFGGFGATAATSVAPTGFGGFGTTQPVTTGGFGTTQPATGGFGTGLPATTGGFGATLPATTGGFGATLPATTGGFGATLPATTGGFGATQPATTGFSGFGGFGGATTGFGAGTSGFGATVPVAGTFGAPAAGTFGAPAAGTFGATGFGTTGFGTGLTGQAGFGAGGFQQVQQQAASEVANIAMAVSLPQIYGDERDTIIAKWNQLQASWGKGKGYYSQNGMVEFKPDNPFCRFKAIGYHAIPTGKNEDGLVALTLNKNEKDVSAAQQQIVDVLHKIFGRKPTLSICVEGIRPLPDDKTELVIYVLDRPASGPAKRVAASDLFTFFSQPATKSQLASQLIVENIVPKMGWTDEQLKDYLDKPQVGIEAILWQQAKLDNPDPARLIPVPLIGFKEVQRRLQHQQEQTKLHQKRLDVMTVDLTELQNKHNNMLSRLEEYKRKHLEVGHRLLQVIVKQEIYRKMGYAIQAEEEHVRVQLDVLQTELNHPTQFKGRLNELMSQIRMQNHVASGRQDSTFQLDPELQLEVKQLLKQQQEGLNHLIEILKDNTTDLHLIERSLTDSSLHQRK